MKFDKTEVHGFASALRGMRNPMNSWDKQDSAYKVTEEHPLQYRLYIGENDLKLAQKLVLAGTEHRKFMRQIMISVDITAPLYWWKEFDTYKIGVTANSTSTMHKLSTTPITMDCFEIDDYNEDLELEKEHDYTMFDFTESLIEDLEQLRQSYLLTKDKRYWKELIRWLPESCLQTRTVTMNYENARSMYFQRRSHKLTEWSESFITWIDTLPYANELIKYEKGENK